MRGLITVISVFAVGVYAGTIEVISSFDPSFRVSEHWILYAVSIEHDGRYLWTTVDGYFLKRIPPGGSIVATYRVGGIWSGGLAYDGTYLYTTDIWETYHIYRFDPSRGAIVGSFSTPPATSGRGLAYGGGYLYFIDTSAGVLYTLTTGGSVVGSYILGFEKPYGLAYVKCPVTPYLFCSTRPYGISWQAFVYCITTTGSILGSAVWPIADYGAAGLAYDGEYLWGIHNDGGAIDNLALQMRYTDIGIKPASVGRIKALYR